jgi:hypothetical protein
MKKILLSLFAVLALCLGLSAAASASSSAAAPCTNDQIEITRLGYNAPGVDDNGDRNKEYVRLSNKLAVPCSLAGWKIHDNYKAGNGTWGNSWTFPAGAEIGGSAVLYVYNGAGVNDSDSLYRDFKHHFNNAGDTVYVENGSDVVVDKVTYDDYQFWAPLP